MSDASPPSQFAATRAATDSEHLSPRDVTIWLRMAALSVAAGAVNCTWKSNLPVNPTDRVNTWTRATLNLVMMWSHWSRPCSQLSNTNCLINSSFRRYVTKKPSGSVWKPHLSKLVRGHCVPQIQCKSVFAKSVRSFKSALTDVKQDEGCPHFTGLINNSTLQIFALPCKSQYYLPQAESATPYFRFVGIGREKMTNRIKISTTHNRT